MNKDEFVGQMNSVQRVESGSPLHLAMHSFSQSAQKITAEINGAYHTPEQMRELFSELFGIKAE